MALIKFTSIDTFLYLYLNRDISNDLIMDALPDDILIKIFSYTDINDIIRLSGISKKYNELYKRYHNHICSDHFKNKFNYKIDLNVAFITLHTFNSQYNCKIDCYTKYKAKTVGHILIIKLIIDNQGIHKIIQESIYPFARSHNVMRIVSGMAGLAYSS